MNFLRSFDTNPKSAVVIRSIVNLAKELGMHTLAEGVETEEQFAFLQEIGCEKVQGYLFSPPIPLTDAIAYCYGPAAKGKDGTVSPRQLLREDRRDQCPFEYAA